MKTMPVVEIRQGRGTRYYLRIVADGTEQRFAPDGETRYWTTYKQARAAAEAVAYEIGGTVRKMLGYGVHP